MSIDPVVRPLPYSNSLFKTFKVDSSKFSEQAKPWLVVEFEDEKEELEADPSS